MFGYLVLTHWVAMEELFLPLIKIIVEACYSSGAWESSWVDCGTLLSGNTGLDSGTNARAGQGWVGEDNEVKLFKKKNICNQNCCGCCFVFCVLGMSFCFVIL